MVAVDDGKHTQAMFSHLEDRLRREVREGAPVPARHARGLRLEEMIQPADHRARLHEARGTGRSSVSKHPTKHKKVTTYTAASTAATAAVLRIRSPLTPPPRRAHDPPVPI